MIRAIERKQNGHAKAGYSLEERLLDNCTALDAEDGGCWISEYAAVKGYPVISQDGKLLKASRVAHEVWIGPIPEGLHVDHVRSRGCTSTLCINPAHLEAVPPGENLLRSPITLNSIGAAKTRCDRGHPFDEANTYRVGNKRRCRTCGREDMRRYRAAKKES